MEVINFQHCKIYQGDNLVLSDVNFTLNKSEFKYIIGKTGTGKSSFLKTLYADLPLMDGEASIVGFDLKKLKRKDVPMLRRKLGIVFQDFQLLTDRNVHDNLEFVLKATGQHDKVANKMIIEDVLNKVGLKTKGFKMPHEISGGEQQRVVIARALLNKPDLILADEPTGNLDPETSDEIMQLLRQIHQQTHTAVLMATHDYRLIEKFPATIVRCVNGGLVEEQEISFSL